MDLMGFSRIGSRFLALWTLLSRACEASRCEQITVSFCRSLGYNFTSMPNDLGHQRQHDVHFELVYLRDIIEARCSPHSRRFLCAMFLPRCSWTGPSGLTVEHPCRQDCELVKNGCEHYLNRSGSWPHFLSCNRLPRHNCLQISAPAAPSIDISVSRDSSTNAAALRYFWTLDKITLICLIASIYSTFIIGCR